MDVFKLKVFPTADIFPMLSEDELQALAVDIKTNGLRHPLVVANVDGVDVLVDGRNRREACKLAGVTPEVCMLNGEDLIAFVASENIHRRNISKGQRAMAMALCYPEPAKLKRKGSSSETEDRGFSAARLSQARQVLRHSRELAMAVMADKIRLDDALDKVRIAQLTIESGDEQLAQLKAAAPDLADLVSEEKLKLGEAVAAHEKRQEEERQRRRLVTEQLAEIVTATDNDDAAHAAKKTVADFDPDAWPEEDELTCELLVKCAKYLTAVAKEWEKVHGKGGKNSKRKGTNRKAV